MQQIAAKITAKSQNYAMNIYKSPTILNKNQKQKQNAHADNYADMQKKILHFQKKQSVDFNSN